MFDTKNYIFFSGFDEAFSQTVFRIFSRFQHSLDLSFGDATFLAF